MLLISGKLMKSLINCWNSIRLDWWLYSSLGDLSKLQEEWGLFIYILRPCVTKLSVLIRTESFLDPDGSWCRKSSTATHFLRCRRVEKYYSYTLPYFEYYLIPILFIYSFRLGINISFVNRSTRLVFPDIPFTIRYPFST